MYDSIILIAGCMVIGCLASGVVGGLRDAIWTITEVRKIGWHWEDFKIVTNRQPHWWLMPTYQVNSAVYWVVTQAARLVTYPLYR